MDEAATEAEALDRTAAWRLRRLDAEPDKTVHADAANRLERLAAELRHEAYPELWTELRAITHWLGESDLISDYADAAAAYRVRIGDDELPQDGAAYLQALLAIARSLV